MHHDWHVKKAIVDANQIESNGDPEQGYQPAPQSLLTGFKLHL